MDARDVHILLDDDAVGLGLGECCLGRSLIARLPVVDVVGGLPVLLVGTQQRRIRVERLMRIDHDGQRLVFHVDGGHAIGGGVAAGGDDEGDFLHLVMHAIQRQHCLGIGGKRGHPGQPGGIQVLAGNDS